MSEYYNFETEERMFPDDDFKTIKQEKNFFEGIELDFKFNCENKEPHPESDQYFLFNCDRDAGFTSDTRKISDTEVFSQNLINLKLNSPVLQIYDNNRNFQILNKLKKSDAFQESDIFPKSFLNNFNDRFSCIKSQSLPSGEPMIINQNINNNFFMNSSLPILTDDLRYSESQLININKIEKMKADQQISNSQQVVRNISEEETSYSKKNCCGKTPFFKTEKINKKNSSKFETISLNSESSSRKLSDILPNNNNKKEIKKTIKLIRNRLAAQKSRLKKKFSIQKMEAELVKTKEALAYYKLLYENGHNSKKEFSCEMLEVFYI